MPKLECILAFLRPVSILLLYINLVIDQYASALLISSYWANYVQYLTGAEGGAALMKHLQFIKMD